MTDTQLIEIYHIVFSNAHSPGFMKAEVKTLLNDNEYGFIEKPNENWVSNLFKYFEDNNIKQSTLNMNPTLIKYYS